MHLKSDARVSTGARLRFSWERGECVPSSIAGGVTNFANVPLMELRTPSDVDIKTFKSTCSLEAESCKMNYWCHARLLSDWEQCNLHWWIHLSSLKNQGLGARFHVLTRDQSPCHKTFLNYWRCPSLSQRHPSPVGTEHVIVGIPA